MKAKEEALELLLKFRLKFDWTKDADLGILKHCALICVENEYRSNRELLFNLRSCMVIESGNVYLKRIVLVRV